MAKRSTNRRWSPSEADFLKVLEDQNPWHKLNRVPTELAPATRRPLAEVLWQILLKPAVARYQIILGPRRVGKTVVMHQTVAKLLEAGIPTKRLWWLRLDHPLLIELDLGQLVRFILRQANATPENPIFLFLDEITYAEKWDLWLKAFFDEKWPVRLVGTSSATAAIRQRGTESGVGRWEEQFLAPYLFTEFLSLLKYEWPVECHESLAGTIRGLIDREFLPAGIAEKRRRFAITGGFPELLIAQGEDDEASQIFRSQRILRTDAIEKAIYKDIPQAFQVLEPAKLERLLYALAAQIAGIFSPTTIANDLRLTEVTIDKYVRYCERAFLVFMLPSYAASEETVQRRGRKLYFVDGAVRNAALMRGLSPLDDPAEMGLLVENLAASHMHTLSQQSGLRLYHWRHKKFEVDLVYDHPTTPLAFEITGAADHHSKGLREFEEKFPRFEGSCYLVSTDTKFKHAIAGEPGKIPLDAFLLAVGNQTQKALENRIGIKPSRK